MRLIQTFFLLFILIFNAPPYKAGSVECDYMLKMMNKLGRDMARNRQIVALYGDSERGTQASQNLSQQTKDYRLTKKQYQKSYCEDSWIRD